MKFPLPALQITAISSPSVGGDGGSGWDNKRVVFLSSPVLTVDDCSRSAAAQTGFYIVNVKKKEAPSYRERPKPKILGLIRTKVSESFPEIPLNLTRTFVLGQERLGSR